MTITVLQGTLVDSDQHAHALTMDQDGLLLLDGSAAHLVMDTQIHLTLVTPTAAVRCTMGAIWQALAGKEASATAEDAGYWLVQTMLLQHQVMQWRTQVDSLVKQLTERLTLTLPALTLPHPRLDAFTEACLARCDAHPTLAQVQALATLLQQEVQTVTRWLEERGKHVMMLTPPVPTWSENGASADVEEGEQVQDVPCDVTVPDAPEQTEDVSVAPSSVQTTSATMTAPASTRPVSARTKPGQFKWTDERTAQLHASFLALPVSAQYSRRAAAITIARQQNWPLPSVLYKLYALYPLPSDEAEPGVEVVERGAFLWDVQVTQEGEPARRERWELAYALGNFPYAPQTQVKYRGQRYEVQQVHSNLLMMRLGEQVATMPEVETPPARQDLLEPVGV